jgi:hypothetical protein
VCSAQQDDAQANERPDHAEDSLVDAGRVDGAVAVIQAVTDARQSRLGGGNTTGESR